MPTEGRSLREASHELQDRLNGLLAHCVTRKPLIVVDLRRGEVVQLAFWERGSVSAAPLRTIFGIMNLFVGIVCDSVATDSRRQRLRIRSYRYTIWSDGAAEPVFRWEYVSRINDPDALWCRHHIQGPSPVNFGNQTLPLNDLHTPTGVIPLEEVLRFCIVDLGVRPLSEDWDARLQASAERGIA